VAERLLDEKGALLPGHDALAAELRDGWLARVGAGEVLAEVAEAASATEAAAAQAAAVEAASAEAPE